MFTLIQKEYGYILFLSIAHDFSVLDCTINTSFTLYIIKRTISKIQTDIITHKYLHF